MSNRIIIVESDGAKHEVNRIDGIDIAFTGDNACVKIHKPMPVYKKCRFRLGDNGLIEIKKSVRYIDDLSIFATAPNSVVTIGENFSCYTTSIMLENERNLSVSIGDYCIFAAQTRIRTSDAHAIIDLTNGSVLNKGGSVVIGNRVWLTLNTTIMKNVRIPDWTIVGLGSIVTKSFKEPHCIIAGIPAKVIKRNILWDYRDAYIMEHPLNVVRTDSSTVWEIEAPSEIRSSEIIFEKDVFVPESTNIWNSLILKDITFKPNETYQITIDDTVRTKGDFSFYQFAIKNTKQNSVEYIKNLFFGCQYSIFFKTSESMPVLEFKIYSGEAGTANDKSLLLKHVCVKRIVCGECSK